MSKVVRIVRHGFSLAAICFVGGLAPDLAICAEATATYRITFNGNDITKDWVVVAGTLLDSQLVGTATATAQKGEGLCAVANRALGFNHIKLECSKEMGVLLSRLNPAFLKKPYPNEVVYFPNLPIASTYRVNSYDQTVTAEKERYTRATSSNTKKQFLLDDKKEQQLHHGIIALATYRSFRSDIVVPDIAANRSILASLVKFDTSLGEFTISIERIDVPGTIGSPYSLQNLSEWWKSCIESATHVAQDRPPAYTRYLGLAENPTCEATCGARRSCPEVVLFDREVIKHPALLKALHVPLPHPTVTDASSDKCPMESTWSDAFHGTYMAGIIASDDDTSLGPPGIAPHAELLPIDSLANQSLQQLNDLVSQRDTVGGRKFSIFTVAHKLNGQTLANPGEQGDARFTHSETATKIRNASDTLWVVAAGQIDGKNLEEAVEPDLSKTTLAWPMNLGDLPNVIVVTACERCLEAEASIPVWANFSTTDMVTVAAPGGSDFDGIPARVTDRTYARKSGTSQATALVAGLAAEMAACYPGISAKRIKLRLELTARPFLAGISKLASGAVDQKMALLDPDITWIKPRERKTDEMRPVVAVKWCINPIPVTALDNHTREWVAATGLKRLVQVDLPETTSYGFWTASMSRDGQKLDWRKYRVTIDDNGKNLLAVKYTDQDTWHSLRAQDIEDIILGADPASMGECP